MGEVDTATARSGSDANAKRVITVIGLVDVVGALAEDALGRDLYLFDDNKAGGSSGHGTSCLRTCADAEDLVVWEVMPLECEAFARIDDVLIDEKYAPYIDLESGVYDPSSVVYWAGRILKPLPPEGIPYRLAFRLGSRPEPLIAEASSLLLAATPEDEAGLPPEPGTEIAETASDAKPAPSAAAASKASASKKSPATSEADDVGSSKGARK
ncbi:hypothetical protein [Rhodovulum sulfidophilum]|uniref:Uncharacterized protein n=1 Tax=Rhodovulum sulfidophilum TaxID=35806 RepID=A0ABS1RSG1_RHOSU|nr:hypothetical protein [Rhodovulum sulfidophilum]MBL3552724.1 hypothetical protein [Rhodovulum sulfidophilum]MBL3609003.1 hypothetical protein [Rhodovulum sulfidophilum]MCE8456957.1 hypothetical protein [Rhodovulum sulfidophilum]OLS47575.1 hypothetical protein BV379_04260 [Rhodovulum sulfidophilum]